MTIYGLYIFDRHCNCVFYANYNGKIPRSGPTTLQNVHKVGLQASLLPPSRRDSTLPAGTAAVTRFTQASSASGSNIGGGVDGDRAARDEARPASRLADDNEHKQNALPFDEEAKLVYGIVFSLRNMIRKLSGRNEDSFHSFSTSAYKLHYLNTPTSLHLVLITSPMVESLRFVLRQVYMGAYNDFVIRNPLIDLDSVSSGKGIDNEAFRAAVDKIFRGL